jgi:hypothetical protein
MELSRLTTNTSYETNKIYKNYNPFNGGQSAIHYSNVDTVGVVKNVKLGECEPLESCEDSVLVGKINTSDVEVSEDIAANVNNIEKGVNEESSLENVIQ